MKNQIISRIVLIVALILVSPVIGGCGSKMEGTYSQAAGGMITLDLKSGGKATFTMMGESMPCTYKVKGDKLNLDWLHWEYEKVKVAGSKEKQGQVALTPRGTA